MDFVVDFAKRNGLSLTLYYKSESNEWRLRVPQLVTATGDTVKVDADDIHGAFRKVVFLIESAPALYRQEKRVEQIPLIKESYGNQIKGQEKIEA